MSDIKNLKCYCCRCYDSFDGCVAWNCADDFEISIEKIKEVSQDYGLSIADITALIDFERRAVADELYYCWTYRNCGVADYWS